MRNVKDLSPESAKIRTEIKNEWRLSRLEEVYLRQALRENDQAIECEAKARAEGLTLEDKGGRKYLNPLCIQAKTSRNNYLRLMKLVGFERVLKEKVKRRVGRPTELESQKMREDEDAE